MLTPKKILEKKKKRQKIAALTAYDFPFAKILDEAGADIILVGDSLGMVVLGYETTLPVTMEAMVHHTKAVAAAVKKALLVADMPYRSYLYPAQAVKNAKLLLKSGAQAVKLEGGRIIEKQIQALIKNKIPVMGHLGMTPQSVEKFGGYKVQGREPKQAQKVLEDALLLEKLGVFAIVLECVPAKLGAQISKVARIPVIGIGAGASVDGQILVLHDMLGFDSGVRPRFVRKYAALGEETQEAVREYLEDVRSEKFPSAEESY